jgi:excisionase family DNA binding protein
MIAYERQQIITADDIQLSLRQLTRIPGKQLQLVAKLVGTNGEEIALPDSLVTVLQSAAQLLLQGEDVMIVPASRELTTQEAADYLNMSRQHLVHLLEAGEIPFTKTGTHRRVKVRNVVAYEERRAAHAREIIAELVQLGQETGDYGPTD